jgi:hypothetical protein
LPLAAGGEVTTAKVDFEPNVVEGRALITAGVPLASARQIREQRAALARKDDERRSE